MNPRDFTINKAEEPPMIQQMCLLMETFITLHKWELMDAKVIQEFAITVRIGRIGSAYYQ
jgi:hypothetical protein